MSEVTLFGFPRSVYVQMAGIVLTHKQVQYAFHDLENRNEHTEPYCTTPIRTGADPGTWRFYGLRDQRHRQLRGRCVRRPEFNAVGSTDAGAHEPVDQRGERVLYPYLIYHVSHERNVFPQLGIASDEMVVAYAMPKVEICLQTLERELLRTGDFLIGPDLSLADFFMLPIIHGFGFAPEAQAMYPRFPSICAWRERMEASQ